MGVQLEGAMMAKADTNVVKHDVEQLTESLEEQLVQKADKLEINERLEKMISISRLNELEKRMYDLNLAVETQLRDLINTYSVRMETVQKTKADIVTMDLALKSKADHMDMKELSEQMLRMDKEIVILAKEQQNAGGGGSIGKQLEESLQRKHSQQENTVVAIMSKVNGLEKISREDRKAREIMEQHQAAVLLQLKKVKHVLATVQDDERSIEGLLQETQKVVMDNAEAIADLKKEKKRVTVATIRRQQRLRDAESRGSSNSSHQPLSPLPPVSPPPSRNRGGKKIMSKVPSAPVEQFGQWGAADAAVGAF